jgi:flagellin-like hook-associated protein FlgL
VFQGNNNARVVQTSETTSENINTTAQNVFGAGGIQVFQDAIALYNIMRYKPDGTARVNEPLTQDETNRVQTILQNFSRGQDRFVTESARMGGVENRMEILTEQAYNELTRLKELRSLKEDIDMGQVALDLKKNETVLDATLQVGRDIIQRSLLDFLR